MAVKNFWLSVWCQFYSQKFPYILENSQKKFGVNKTKLRPGTFKKASPPKTGLLESESLLLQIAGTGLTGAAVDGQIVARFG